MRRLKWPIIVSVFLLFLSVNGSKAADWALYKSGLQQAKQGNHGKALRTWMSLFKKRNELSKPQQLRLSVAMARVYLKLGKKKKAGKLVKYAEKLAPNNKTVKALRKKVGVDFGKAYEAALEDLDTALLNERVSPGSGVDLLKGAMPTFKKAVTQKGKDPRAHFGLALCQLYVKSDDSGAEKSLLKTTELDSGHFDAWTKLGELYERQGKVEKSFACYKKCVDGGKASGPIYAALAKSLAQQGVGRNNMGEIVKYVNGAVKDDPSYGDGIADMISDVTVSTRIAAIVREAHKNAERRRKRQDQGYGTATQGGRNSSRTVVIPKMDGKTGASKKRK